MPEQAAPTGPVVEYSDDLLVRNTNVLSYIKQAMEALPLALNMQKTGLATVVSPYLGSNIQAPSHPGHPGPQPPQ